MMEMGGERSSWVIGIGLALALCQGSPSLPLASARLGSPHTLAHPLVDDVVLRQRMGPESAGRPGLPGRDVHGRVERGEPDAVAVEFVDQGYELAGATPEA